MPPRPLSFGPAPTMTMSPPQVRVITFLIIELRSNHSNFKPVVLILHCTDLSPRELKDVNLDFEDKDKLMLVDILTNRTRLRLLIFTLPCCPDVIND